MAHPCCFYPSNWADLWCSTPAVIGRSFIFPNCPSRADCFRIADYSPRISFLYAWKSRLAESPRALDFGLALR